MWSPFGRNPIDQPWEVVGSKSVEPVPTFDDHDDLDIVRASPTDISAKSVFDVKLPFVHATADAAHPRRFDLESALRTARSRLLKEAARLGYNVFLLEGWSVTLMRKHVHPTSPSPPPSASSAAPLSLCRSSSTPSQPLDPRSLWRVSILYKARPALARDPPPRQYLPPPPFVDLLLYWGAQAEAAYGPVPAESREELDAVKGRCVRRRWTWSARRRESARPEMRERRSESAVEVRSERMQQGEEAAKRRSVWLPDMVYEAVRRISVRVGP